MLRYRRIKVCMGVFIGVVSLNAAVLLAQRPCTKTLPEDPAPLCGVAASQCEQIANGGCPAVASCASTQGIYRANVPKGCEDPGGYGDCVWANDTTLCTTSKSCKQSAPGGNGKCVSVATCGVANDSYRTNIGTECVDE